jgi:hypothetical protein
MMQSVSDMFSRYSFFSAPRANNEPEPTPWKCCSSFQPPVTS